MASVAHIDALVRVQPFTEQNFNYIESVGLLGATRYLFELVGWLKLMEQDERYGLVYYHEPLQKQRRYYADLRDHLKREVALLTTLHDEEERLMNERLAEIARLVDPAAAIEAMRRAVADTGARQALRGGSDGLRAEMPPPVGAALCRSNSLVAERSTLSVPQLPVPAVWCLMPDICCLPPTAPSSSPAPPGTWTATRGGRARPGP